MELILLENVKNLGSLGKVVKVKPGFGRNYLLPQNKAVLANKYNLKYFEDRKEELKYKEEERTAQLAQRAQLLNGMNLTISALASEEGKLYGSIGAVEIAAVITSAGGNVTKQEVLLPHGPIKELGTHSIQLGLNHSEILVQIQLVVIPKEKS